MPKPYQITPEIIAKCERLAAQGLTMEQIGSVLGVSDTTLYVKQNENPELLEALKRGRSKGIATITNKLFEKASDGDTTSMIFYLKNRAPKEWCEAERQAAQANQPAEVKVKVVKAKKARKKADTTAAKKPKTKAAKKRSVRAKP